MLLVAMDFLHGAGERIHHRRTSVTLPTTVSARREPRALEMPRHLVAHDVGLLAHLRGKRIVAARHRFIDHHRKRRLQRMREIADMGARALDDFAVGVDQRIGLARERRDLVREIFLPAARRCRSGSPRGSRKCA